MVENALFTIGSDMPLCKSSSEVIPTNLISYDDAKHIHKTRIKENSEYHVDAFIHFYIDDQKFDGKRSSIWLYPEKALDIIQHFAGIITPDFSTYLDFPAPIKNYNIYRMLSFGRWISQFGIPVINNVRWGTEETWEYCFDGIPYNSIVAIGTVASGINKIKNRTVFENGLFQMVKLLKPHTIIVYGSSNYTCFEKLQEIGITLITFPSKTSLAFASQKGGDVNE